MGDSVVPSAGRPAPALLILAAMFAIARLMHPTHPRFDARPLVAWGELPVVARVVPAIDVATGKGGASATRLRRSPLGRAGHDVAIPVVPRALGDVLAATDAPIAEPLLSPSTPLLASAPLPVVGNLTMPSVMRAPDTASVVNAGTGAVSSALATAFHQTGGAIGLAFRKTGAGFRTAF